jgi:hypothetical protein
MKEIVDGTEYNDGVPIRQYQGRFAKVFDILPEDGLAVTRGDLVAHVVISRVAPAKFSDTKSGELKRINTFNIEDVIQLTPERAKFLLDEIGRKVNGINDGLVEVVQLEIQDIPLEIKDVPSDIYKLDDLPDHLKQAFNSFDGAPWPTVFPDDVTTDPALKALQASFMETT